MIRSLIFLFTLFLFSENAIAENNLKIGVLPAADSIILHVAADDGLFARQGLQVELIPFQSALELGAAMRAGTLDGHFGDCINVLMQNETGAPQSIVATTSHSATGNRHFGIVVSPQSRVHNLEELKGKEIAISSATIIDLLLSRLLEQQQMPADTLNPQDIRQISVRLQMLLGGQIESALLPEPLVSLVESKGARTILDDRTLNMPLAVIALRRDLLAGPDGALLRKGFRAALVEAAQKINDDPAACKARMEQKKLLPRGGMEHYTPPRFDMAHTPLGLPSPEDISTLSRWMLSRSMLRTAPVYTDVVSQN